MVLIKFRFVMPSIPHSFMKEDPFIKDAAVFAVCLFHKDSKGLQPLGTLTMLAKSGVLYLGDRKIRKKPNPFPIWKVWFGLYWFGAPSGTRTRDTLIKSQVLYQLS